MSARLMLLAGIAVLLFAWAGPLPGLVPSSFAAHMWLHMSVVGIAAPLIAGGIAGKVTVRSQLALPIVASLADLVVVWGWHAPALHHLSRSAPEILALEQGTFLAVSLLVWLVAVAGTSRQEGALGGAMTLFFTSMHMTLLGALLALAPRPIYGGHDHGAWFGLTPLADQQLGGVVMLAVGGLVYLSGGLVLMGRVLRQRTTP